MSILSMSGVKNGIMSRFAGHNARSSRRTSTVLTLLTSGNLEAEAAADTTGEATTEAMAEAKKVTFSRSLFFSFIYQKNNLQQWHSYIHSYVLQVRTKNITARSIFCRG